MLRHIFSVYFLAATLISSFLFSYSVARGRSRHQRLFALLNITLCFYMLGYLVELNSTSLEQMLFWNKIQFVGLPFLTPLWLWIALDYTNFGRSLTRMRIGALFVIPFISFLLRMTNAGHDLYFNSSTIGLVGEMPILVLGKGAWYYVQSVYMLICLCLTTYVFYRAYRRRGALGGSQLSFLLFASILPYLGLILILTRALWPGIDYTAFLMPFSAALMAIAIFRHDFLQIQSLARETVFETSEDAMLIVDMNLRVLDYNASATNLFALFGIDLDREASLKEMAHNKSDLVAALMRPEGAEIALQIDEEKRVLELSITKMRSISGAAIGALRIVRDVTEQRNLQQKLRTLASIDHLSNIPNRRHFMELAQEQIGKGLLSGEPLSLLMMDLDHFKGVNDTYGHMAGDALIGETASLMKSCFRPEDILGRLGGEEFAVLLPGLDERAAQEAAERFRLAREKTASIVDGHDIFCTISIGSATARGANIDLAELLKAADRALYEAKAQGRNRYVHSAG